MHLVIAPPSGPSLARQRATSLHSGAVSDRAPGTTVTPWTSDPTYPASVNSTGIIVAGSGTATVTTTLTVNRTQDVHVIITVDGVAVADTVGTLTTTWTGDLAAGQIVGVRAWCMWAGTNLRSNGTGAAHVLEIIPT